MTAVAEWSWCRCPRPGCTLPAVVVDRWTHLCCHGEQVQMCAVACPAGHRYTPQVRELVAAGPEGVSGDG